MPAAMLVAPAVMPETCTGTLRLVVVPSPSPPWAL